MTVRWWRFAWANRQGPEPGYAHGGRPYRQPLPDGQAEPREAEQGYQQLGVEVYGGALLNPWFDRDLSLAGRVSFGSPGGRAVQGPGGFPRPVAVIPSLAIHLDREVNKNRSINPQTDIVPLLGMAEKLDFRELLAAASPRSTPSVEVGAGAGLRAVPATTHSRRRGWAWTVSSLPPARLDNLLSCYAGLRPCWRASVGDTTCWSATTTRKWAASPPPAPRAVPAQRAGAHGGQYDHLRRPDRALDDDLRRLRPRGAAQLCQRHDENHGPLLNGRAR